MGYAEHGWLRWWGAAIDVLAGLVVLVLMLALFFWGLPSPVSGPPPAPTVVAGFWITASALAALIVLGFCVAVSQRRWVAVIVYPIVGAVVVGTILWLALPMVDWGGDPTPAVNPFACTLTDSENCPGG